ncbi:MAG: hypothetical protein Q9202_004193 [Teloschistes flavicans]
MVKRDIFELFQGTGTPLLSLACHGNLIAAGTEFRNSQAIVIVWYSPQENTTIKARAKDLTRDSRAASQPLLQYVESHSDDVTDLAFHPSQPSRLLSGSTDSLVNLYDTTITDEDDALIQVFNHGSSIAHADFLSDHEVFALSHDEIFSVYDLRDLPQDHASNSAQHFGDLRPQLHCDYVVGLMSSRSKGPLLGAGSYRSLVPYALFTAMLTSVQ